MGEIAAHPKKGIIERQAGIAAETEDVLDAKGLPQADDGLGSRKLVHRRWSTIAIFPAAPYCMGENGAGTMIRFCCFRAAPAAVALGGQMPSAMALARVSARCSRLL